MGDADTANLDGNFGGTLELSQRERNG